LFPVGLNFLTIKYFPEFKNEKNKHHGYLPLLLLISTCSFLLFSLFLFLSKNYFTRRNCARQKRNSTFKKCFS
jgi:hypothetical protein